MPAPMFCTLFRPLPLFLAHWRSCREQIFTPAIADHFFKITNCAENGAAEQWTTETVEQQPKMNHSINLHRHFCCSLVCFLSSLFLVYLYQLILHLLSPFFPLFRHNTQSIASKIHNIKYRWPSNFYFM